MKKKMKISDPAPDLRYTILHRSRAAILLAASISLYFGLDRIFTHPPKFRQRFFMIRQRDIAQTCVIRCIPQACVLKPRTNRSFIVC